MLTFRFKEGSDWKPVPLRVFSGLSGEESLLYLDGTETVAEYRHGDDRGYLCGLPKWVDYYRAKGFKAMSFKEAVEKLKRTQPHVMEAVWGELPREAEAVFGECGLVEVRSRV